MPQPMRKPFEQTECYCPANRNGVNIMNNIFQNNDILGLLNQGLGLIGAAITLYNFFGRRRKKKKKREIREKLSLYLYDLPFEYFFPGANSPYRIRF